MAYSNDDIQGFYKKYLGRGFSNAGEGQGWLDNPDAEEMIKGSGEGQAFAAKQKAPAQAATPVSTWNAAPVASQARPTTVAAAPAPTTGGGFVAERAAVAAHPENAFGNASVEQQVRNIWNASPDHTPENLARLAAEFGLKTGGTHGDTITMPDGRTIDAIMDVGGLNNPGWLDTATNQPSTGSQGGGSSRGGGGSRSGAGGGGSASSSMSASSSGYGSNAQRDALFNTLMDRSKQSLNINAQTDPMIRQQADPYAAAMERQNRNYLADTAERSGPYANLQGERRMASERTGQAAGQFEASLIGRELENRRTEIQNALTQAGGMLSQDQQLAMQRELATINDSLQRAQMKQQGQQFGQTLGQQGDMFASGLAERDRNYWTDVDFRERGY